MKNDQNLAWRAGPKTAQRALCLKQKQNQNSSKLMIIKVSFILLVALLVIFNFNYQTILAQTATPKIGLTITGGSSTPTPTPTPTITPTATPTNTPTVTPTPTPSNEKPAPPTLDPLHPSYWSNQPVSVCGTTIANGIVTIYLDGKAIAVIKADASGHFCYKLTNLSTGCHQVYATVMNSAGQVSVKSNPQNFCIRQIWPYLAGGGAVAVSFLIGLILLILYLRRPTKLAIVIAESDLIWLYLPKNKLNWQMPIMNYKSGNYEKIGQKLLVKYFQIADLIMTRRLPRFKFKQAKIQPLLGVHLNNFMFENQIELKPFRISALPQKLGSISAMAIQGRLKELTERSRGAR